MRKEENEVRALLNRGCRKVIPCIMTASVAAASGGAALGIAGSQAAACDHSGVHDVKTFGKTSVVRTYKLPRDKKPWQYRVVCSHKRVYGCGYAGGQAKKGIYLSKGQRLYVMKDPKGGPSVTVSAGFGYGGASCSASVKIPLGKQGAKSSTMAPTYNKAAKSGYYKAYSHVVYDVYTTATFRRIWDKSKGGYTKWTRYSSKGLTTKSPYAFKYQLVRS